MPVRGVSVPRLSFTQRLRLRLWGNVPVGLRVYKGWKALIMFYAFRCNIHGVVCDYPHGHSQTLSCPMCRGQGTVK